MIDRYIEDESSPRAAGAADRSAAADDRTAADRPANINVQKMSFYNLCVIAAGK